MWFKKQNYLPKFDLPASVDPRWSTVYDQQYSILVTRYRRTGRGLNGFRYQYEPNPLDEIEKQASDAADAIIYQIWENEGR